MSTLRELIVSIDFDGIDLRKLLKLDSIMDEVEDTLGLMGAELQDVAEETRDLAREADYLGRELRNTGRDAERMGDSLRETGGSGGSAFDSLIRGAKQFVAALGAMYVLDRIIDKFKQMTTTGIEFNATMETLQAKMETALHGDMQAAKEYMDWATDFAKNTPFEAVDVVDATVKLKAYGIEAKNTLTQIGNMAAGMGKGLDQAVEAVADAQTGELERLKEFGITKQMLIDKALALGKGEIVNAQGQITDLKALNESLFAIMDERFKGGMERLSKTFNGMMSNLKDSFSNFMGNLTEPLFNKLKSLIPKVQGYIGMLQHVFEQRGFEGVAKKLLGDDLVDGIKTAISVITGALDFLSGVFEENGGHISRFFTNLSSMAESVFNFLGLLWNAWGNDITAIVSNALSSVLSIASGAFQLISDLFNVFTSVLRGDWSGAMDGIKNLFSNMLGNLLTIGRELLALLNSAFQLNMQDILIYLNSIDLMQVGRDIINGLINGMSSMFDSAVNYVKQFGQDIKQALIDFFDIHSPSREMAWIGEQITAGVEVGISRRAESAITAAENLGSGIYAGAAQIVPSGGTSGVSGGHTFAPNITIQINGVSGNAENIAQEAAAAARREFMKLWEELQVKFA